MYTHLIIEQNGNCYIKYFYPLILGNSDIQPTDRWSDGHMGFWAGRSGRRYPLVLWLQSGESIQKKGEHTEVSNGPIWGMINK